MLKICSLSRVFPGLLHASGTENRGRMNQSRMIDAKRVNALLILGATTKAQ